SINVNQSGKAKCRAGTLVGQVNGRCFGIDSPACDWTDGSSRWIVGGNQSCRQIWHACGIVPVRLVVAAHAKVRSTDDFQVVRRTRMTDGEEVGRRIRRLQVRVDEWRIRIAHN